MKTATSFAVAVVLAALLSDGSSGASCKRLTNDDSPFATAAKAVAGADDSVKDLFDVLRPIDTAFPWLSTCIASINPMTVYSTITCNATISSFALPDDVTDSSLRSSLCPFYGDTLMPCINNVAIQALVDAMAGTGGCCDAMKNEIQAAFGSDIQTMVADLLTKFGQAICTFKTFTGVNGKSTTESCLQSLSASFMSPDTMKYLFSLVQMPTDQVCKAVNGESFTTTQNAASQFQWSSQGMDTFGICYEPFSALVKTIASYPIMTSSTTVNANTISMADLFASGKCLQTSAVFKWLLDTDSLVMTWAKTFDDTLAVAIDADPNLKSWNGTNVTDVIETTMNYFKQEVPSMCLHIATGQKCDYGSATTTVVLSSKTTKATTTTKNSAGSLLISSVFFVASFASLMML